MEVLAASGLFMDISRRELAGMLTCLGATEQHYAKGEALLWEGEVLSCVGVVLSGGGQTLKTGIGGDLLMVSTLGPGSFIGILLSAGGRHPSPVTVRATEPMQVLWIPADSLLTPCRADCPLHSRLTHNYIRCIADRGMLLHSRIDCLIRPSLREKIAACLEAIQPVRGESFMLPFDRAGMAYYLHVDRSALSRELSRMRQEGIIDFDKSRFVRLK